MSWDAALPTSPQDITLYGRHLKYQSGKGELRLSCNSPEASFSKNVYKIYSQWKFIFQFRKEEYRKKRFGDATDLQNETEYTHHHIH